MKRAIIASIVIVVAGAALVLLWPRQHAPRMAAGEFRPPAASKRVAPARPAPAPVLAVVEDSRRLHAPDATPNEDVAIVGELVGAFRRFAKNNPVGDNDEITAQLLGRHRRAPAVALIDPRNPAIDPQGRLVDRWGTPFFFHALSGRNLEVRSAGPDRTLWTADDVVGE